MKAGATIGCNSKKCHNNFHFNCALSCAVSFLPDKRTFCEHCGLPSEILTQTDLLRRIPSTEGHRELSLKSSPRERELLYIPFSSKVNQRRRIYIAKNSHFCKGIAELNNVPIEHWKPFYLDCFNRIGNLTVLKLNHRLDTFVAPPSEEALSGFSPGFGAPDRGKLLDHEGFISLRIYWDYNKPPIDGGIFGGRAFYLSVIDKKKEEIRIMEHENTSVLLHYLPFYNNYKKAEMIESPSLPPIKPSTFTSTLQLKGE